MLLKENLKMAIKSIRSNKMRSFLTMLGIIIGISSVITIISAGQGAQRYMMQQFEQVGNTTVFINVDQDEATESDKITLEDIRAIKERVPNARYVSEYLQFFAQAGSSGNKKDAIIALGNQDVQHFANVKMISGRFFSEEEYLTSKKVAIIDEQMARLVFGNTDVVGLDIDIYDSGNRIKLKIIGVMKTETTPFAMPNMPGIIAAPSSTYQEVYANFKPPFNNIYMMSETTEATEAVGNNAVSLLEARHSNRGRDIYKAENMLKQMDMINNTLALVQTFVAAVAAISLLVGGIGVMNIMLVAVTERTREIGIRKSLGAKTSSIMFQFLTESAILTLIGGTIGLMLGLLGSYGFCTLAGITPVFSPSIIAGTLFFSATVGIFFGIYPARKAAKLSPIEALRHQ